MNKNVILMAPLFGAGGPMQLCLLRSLQIGIAQVLRPAKSAGHQDDKRWKRDTRPFAGEVPLNRAFV